MPIRPENRDKYPPDWAEISRRIRFERAGGQCEWVDETDCRMTGIAKGTVLSVENRPIK